MIVIIAVLLRVCASSVTIHSIPAASRCAPCMAGMNRWQTKCWLQTLIKQLISLLVNCWDFLNCDHSAPKASWSHLNLRLRQVFTFLFYVLLPLFCEELIYWKSWLEIRKELCIQARKYLFLYVYAETQWLKPQLSHELMLKWLSRTSSECISNFLFSPKDTICVFSSQEY